MAKLPSESLLAGRRALDGIPEAKIIQDWQWVEGQKSWALHISLSPALTPTEFIQARTDWFFVVEDRYPLGSIKLYPAEQGGITATFQHQSLNSANKELPWRKGDPCLATNFRQLGREGYDYELKGPHDRLRWHVERALEWLIAASKDQVAELNEPFELPPEHNPVAGTVIFNESMSRFEQWNALSDQFGLVVLSPVKQLSDAWHVKSFQTISGKVLLESAWGFPFEETARTALGMWIRVPRIPVVRPWRYPESWDELRSVLATQGVDFDRCCRIASAKLRDGNAHFCLLGFAIPDRVGGAPRMLCWKAIEFSPLTSPHSKGGFGADPNRLWQRDRELFFTPGKPVRWVEAQNWDKNQIQTRGTFPENMTAKRSVLIGVGALGSVLAEMLVRGGVNDLLLVDSDQLKIGNLTRHALTMAEIDKPKSSSMATRLNLISPHAKVRAAASSVESLSEADRKDFLNAEIVWDCTGNDEVFHTLESMPWTASPMCFSLSVSFGARRLFLYSQVGQFGWEWFAAKLNPWLQKDLEERGDEELPREGIGCWHPVFPALATDIHLMVSIALKAIATDAEPGPDPSFQVFEQIDENHGGVVGVHRVEK